MLENIRSAFIQPYKYIDLVHPQVTRDIFGSRDSPYSSETTHTYISLYKCLSNGVKNQLLSYKQE